MPCRAQPSPAPLTCSCCLCRLNSASRRSHSAANSCGRAQLQQHGGRIAVREGRASEPQEQQPTARWPQAQQHVLPLPAAPQQPPAGLRGRDGGARRPCRRPRPPARPPWPPASRPPCQPAPRAAAPPPLPGSPRCGRAGGESHGSGHAGQRGSQNPCAGQGCAAQRSAAQRSAGGQANAARQAKGRGSATVSCQASRPAGLLYAGPCAPQRSPPTVPPPPA